MKNALKLLLILTLSWACKQGYPPPRLELCTTGDEHKLICNDQRQEETSQNYARPYTLNYVCTNPSDFDRLYSYCADMRKKLIKCKRKSK